ncbi:MAG: sugar phosphate isomerase/epimerase [Planctomycetota bacterium]
MSAPGNPIWIMSSAFPGLSVREVIERAQEIGAQGVEVCVFRQGGTRSDHIATHMDYERFGLAAARETIQLFNEAGLRFSIGAYENLIGGPEEARLGNQNHLLRLIRMAHLMGGDANDVKVGTFVGYNHELGHQDRGFERNLEEYARVFRPIVQYAESLGVTILYENCPMEGWRPASSPTTYNNLPCCLAARRLMYALIESPGHGETYDPSHDVWQGTDPVEVVKRTDMARLHRIHVKGTRNLVGEARVYWGGIYPMQAVDPELAARAGVSTCAHAWDRHSYVAKLPGFGGTDSLDWTRFLETLIALGYRGPFVIENEACDSKATGDMGAIVQGFKAALLCLAPLLWPLKPGEGFQYDKSRYRPLRTDVLPHHEVELMTIERLR